MKIIFEVDFAFRNRLFRIAQVELIQADSGGKGGIGVRQLRRHPAIIYCFCSRKLNP